jgi:hypothetical protein
MELQTRLGLARLTAMAYAGQDLIPIKTELIARCLSGEDPAGALMDVSVIDQLRGRAEEGMLCQQAALETCRVFRTEVSEAAQRSLLVFAAAKDIGSNTPVEFLLDGSKFEITTCYVTPDHPIPADVQLDAFDVAFCAAPIDMEDAPQFQAALRRFVAGATVPVFNLPRGPVQMDRDALQHTLADIDGVLVPQTWRADRAALQAMIFGGAAGFPVLARPLGAHAGQGLAKLEGAMDVLAYLAERPEPAFHMTRFCDYATPQDGLYRKYRIVFVAGQALPCHMAIAEGWAVWYLNADMQHSQRKRDEEARFFDSFDTDFLGKHGARLQRIAQAIDLDYFGIDCAEDPEGNLVVFEADNALIVHGMDCPELFGYKTQPMQRIFRAFEAMLTAPRDSAAG